MRLTRVFVDESGDVGSPNVHLIGAVVISENHTEVARIVTETKRKFRTLSRGKVLHAADDPPEVVKFLLTELQKKEQLSLSVGIFNQAKWWWNRSAGNDHAYFSVMAETIRQSLLVADMSPNDVEVIVERKYSSRKTNDTFRGLLSDHLSIEPPRITFETKAASKKERGWTDHLSVADYLAWSYYQHYAKNDDQFINIIDERVTVNHVGIDGEGKVRLVSDDKGKFVED